MRTTVTSNQFVDSNGVPDGGTTFGHGFAIGWQKGPLGTGADRKEPNGAFVEDVIIAALDRLQFYQRSKFACEENATAVDCLQKALAVLFSRTQKREVRGVEGTQTV